MTTENTQHEQHDIATNVGENQSVSEPTTDLTSSETAHPTATEGQTTSSTSEPAPTEAGEVAAADTASLSQKEVAQAEDTSSPPQGEEQSNTPATSTEASGADQATKVSAADETTASTEVSTPTEQPTPLEPPSPASTGEENQAPTYTALPLSGMEAEVRPFTDFIEEFHQAEARLQASAQGSETEVFHLLTPEQEITPTASLVNEGTALEPVVETIEEARTEFATSFPQENSALASSGADTVNHVSEEENTVVAKTPDTVGSPEVTSAAASTTQQAQTAEAVQPETPSKPAERAVSPLLRPASRLRLPRHGTVRHPQREVAPVEERQVAAQEEASTASKPVEQAASVTPATPEASEEVEKPRPARRYRFDRPASSSSQAAPVQPAAPSRSESETGSPEPVVEPAAKVEEKTPVAEQQHAKPQAKQENTEHAATSAQANQEHGRRRQTHDRHKEQPTAAAPAPEVPAPVAAETPAKAQEVAPEDLPPLEYAELQKANSRRRRRHRSNTTSSNGTVAPVVQNTTAVPPVAPTPPASPAPTIQPAATQVAPARPAANMPLSPAPAASSQYTIVSGYTVNQMNQGNEAAGPFMAPEPSPARGSIMSRDGRITSRSSEVQRTQAPTYPHVRTSPETGLTTAALNNFTNTLSQAIQTQTDRMVSELRRVAQAPTNISVTLPPFPSNERVGVFVDVANLLYSARTLRLNIDFGKLLDFLRGNRRLIRAHAYCPTSPQAGEEQMFLQAVKGLGYRITTKNYKTFSSGAKKADLDLDLCMDVVRLVDGRAVDCIVLVSGDSDFMPMLDYCSDHGVRVEVAAFDEAMSATLRQSCDLFINLSMLDEILARP